MVLLVRQICIDKKIMVNYRSVSTHLNCGAHNGCCIYILFIGYRSILSDLWCTQQTKYDYMIMHIMIGMKNCKIVGSHIYTCHILRCTPYLRIEW